MHPNQMPVSHMCRHTLLLYAYTDDETYSCCPHLHKLTHPNAKVCRPATNQKSKYHKPQTITHHTKQIQFMHSTTVSPPSPTISLTETKSKESHKTVISPHSIPNPSEPAREATWLGSREKLKPAASASQRVRGCRALAAHPMGEI
jgi:hypothetical protein